MKYNSFGEVDAAILAKLMTKSTNTTVNVLINGKVVELGAVNKNNTWMASTTEIAKLLPSDTISIRSALESVGYKVSWVDNLIVAQK